MRNKSIAWKPLGYIYDLSTVLSQNQEKDGKVTLKSRRLHKMFDVILETFIEAQDICLNDIELTLGDITNKVNLKLPCFFIIGDMQGGDKLCCTSASYSTSLKQLCRKCNVSGEDAGNPDVECQKIEVDAIKELVNYEDLIALNELNQYCVDNAWFKVNFGRCKYAILSAACLIEPLHAIENGIIPKCIEILFKEQIKSTSHLARLDGLVQEL